MKFKCCVLAWVLGLLYLPSHAQDFSNKGKEFWLAYCYHVGMINAGGPPQMTLYITSDVNTNYTVEIFGVTTIQTGALTAGQVISVVIPTAYFIYDEGIFLNRAIRVTADKPVVVYSYITRSAASGATLCLPTNVLGREYYATSFTQVSNEANSNSYFTIVAVENNTTVEITPSANTKNGWPANSTNTITLNKGEVYQVLGVTNGSTGVDLTGSKIKSIAGGIGGCKRIAVFSGSGKIRIAAGNCPAGTNSSDNLYQQLYPIATWGKKYLTVPSFSRITNIYRVIKSSPTANVYVNGVLVPASSFVNNLYYQFYNTTPNLIESDQPISVAQYFTTQGCDGNAIPYDPDMIMLNPVEQNIDRVTLVSSNLVASNPQHHIHVIMRNGGTGMSSFRVDGNPVPANSWVTHPADPAYSYLYLNNVTLGYHRLLSDSGFNAIAYGYADAETYGYSAGANVKDLYQFVSIQNQYATVNFPAACKNSPFFFSMTFPYQPTQIQWIFSGLFPDINITAPVYDSTWNINGKQLYRYKLTTPYTITSIGTYPIKVLAQNPTSDGCSGEQEINYDLQVFERPQADFNFTSNGCVSDPVSFFDQANLNGRPAIRWQWDFGDGNTAGTANTTHLFNTAGNHDVKYSVITDIGCLSDTSTKTVTLTEPPLARFGISTPNCLNHSISFTDSSSITGGTIVKWYWNFGDGSPDVITSTNAAQSHSYTTTGNFTVTLKVESSGGCQSAVFSKSITIHPNPQVNFSLGNACLPTGAMQFTGTSSISDGSENGFSFQWHFGDGGDASVKDPVHNYGSTGPFSATLVITSNAGCIDSLVRQVNTIYAQPLASFTAPPAICLGDVANFTDNSSAAGSSITQWQWDFGDGNQSAQQSPVHTYSAAGTYTVTLRAVSAIGCTSAISTKNIVVNALPVSNFNISAPLCATKDISFTDASGSVSGNIISWTWDLGDGNVQVNNNNLTFTHVYSAAGNYTVTLITTTDKGCTSPLFSKQVVIHPLPIVGFILPDNCLNDPFSQFIDTSSIADGTEAQFIYSWNFGDIHASPGNPNTAGIKDPKHKYSEVGPYNVSLTVTSVNGCSASRTSQFIVNSTQPQSIFTLATDSLCSNTELILTNQSAIDVGRITRMEIYWDNINDQANRTTAAYPVAGANFPHSYPEFFTPATKDYQVRVVVFSGDSCSHTSFRTITLKATPQVNFQTIAPVCADVMPFQLNQASVINGLAGNGIYSGPGVSSDGIFRPGTAGVGTHNIRYTYNATNGCSNFREQSITVFPVPVADAGPDRFVLEGGNALLLGNGSGNQIGYLWSPSDFLNDPVLEQPTTTPTADITYTLQVTSADGCSASDQVLVKLLKTPSIPNVFTPNGDGINDTWQIKYLDSYPGATVEIYNRYGQMVFHSTGYNRPWDGNLNGRQVPAGTYYYIINPKNGRKQLAGYVDIVR